MHQANEINCYLNALFMVLQLTNRTSDAARSSWAGDFCLQRSASDKDQARESTLKCSDQRLSALASDPRASSYNRQEGFEYLGITVGYISWILRNSREISA